MQPVELDLDPYDPAFLADPFPSYAVMREAGPVVWLKKYGVFAVSRFKEVQEVLKDYETFCSSGGASFRNYFKEKPWRTPSLLLEADPPLHTRTRAVLSRIMSPAAITSLRASIEADAEQLVQELVARGRFDAVADLGEVFPVKVFPDALGLREEGRDNLLKYSLLVIAGFGPRNAFAEQAERYAMDCLPWIEASCRREALRPGSFGAQVYDAVDTGELSEEEAPLLVRSFLSAGLDTSIRGISRAIFALASNQDQWTLLCDKPALARAAYEEMIRHNSPAQNVWRTTTRPVTIEGIEIGKHEKVAVFLGSANRDPARWEAPEFYRINRKTVGHVGLGFGIHGCVGQAVARLEGEAILAAFARHAQTLELDGEPTRHSGIGQRGLRSIPVRVTRRG